MINLNKFKKMFFLNDDLNIIWSIVMLMFLFAPSLFFANSFIQYQNIVGFYIVAVMLIFGVSNFRRIDFSDNWKTYVGYGAIAFLIFASFINSVSQDVSMFRDVIGIFLWYIFVIGLSETYIMIGILEKTKNLFFSIIIMALLHVTSYMYILNNFNFTITLVGMLFQAGIGFFVFYKIYNLTNKPFVVAIIHGLFDLVLIGGLII